MLAQTALIRKTKGEVTGQKSGENEQKTRRERKAQREKYTFFLTKRVILCVV